MESKTGLMSRDSSDGLDAKELASLSDIREEAIATQAATEPEPEPETKHHLSNVPFTQWPMGASPSDRQVGQDDAGNPLFEMQFSKNTYIIKLDPDQRTQKQRLKDAVATGKQAVTNYLQGDDYIPSASEVAEFGKAIAVTAYETLEGAMEGRGTMGDVFGMAPTMAVAGAGFKVPKGALRTFGGKGMDLDDDQTSRFADARFKFKEALNTVDVNDPAAFYDLNKKIWKETGWFINPKDRQWRYEIDDKPATISFDNLASDRNITTNELINNFSSGSTIIKLSELFQHPKLFERYPHLKDMDVQFYQTDTGELGSQSPGQNKININTKVADINNIPELKSIIIHEIQHGIQDYEGFNIGANNDFIPDEVTKDLVDKVDTMRRDLTMKRISILTRLRPRLKEFFDYIPEDRRPDIHTALARVLTTSTPEKMSKDLEEATRTFMENNGIRDYGKIGEDLLKFSKNVGEDYAAKLLTKDMEFKFYRGAGGEIESRLVEARQYLGSNTIFPLDQEQLMLKREGSSLEYEGKVDKAGDSLYRVRSPKLGESDVYFDPLEDRNTIMQRVYKEEGKDPNKVDGDVINKTNEIYVKNIIKGYPELKKIINLKENDKVMIDGNEYEFQKFTVSRESKKFLPETGEIIQRPQAKGQLLRDVIVPRLSLIATDSSLPPEVRFLIPSLAEFLQKTDLVNKPFDIQKLSKPPKSKKSIVGQMKSLFGYDEGGLTTSLRPFTREDSSNKRKNELKQLGNLEYTADFQEALGDDYIARLGFNPNVVKIAYDDSTINPFYNPTGSDRRYKLKDKIIFSDEIGINTGAASDKPIAVHEFRHRGFQMLVDKFKSPDNLKKFKNTYGSEAANLLMKIKADGGDYFSAQFVGPYAEFTNEILDAGVLQDNKRGNRPADQTIMGVNYKKGSPFTTKEGLTEINAQTIFDFQNYLKDPTTLTDPESRNLHTNKDINNIINKEMNKGQIFKGLAGIQKAAKDLLESLPFKTSRKTVSGRTIWRDPKTKEDYSERTTTFQIGNRFYTMPTVAEDGSQYSDDVMKNYVEKYGPIDFITGEELPTFATEKEAVMYAIERSDTRKGTEQ